MGSLLVTGGCGFIGSHFVRRRLGRPGTLDRIVNLDLLTYAGNSDNLREVAGHPGYRHVHGDICDGALVRQLLAEFAVEALVHFAAESHVDRSIDCADPFLQTNVIGTYRLLECARVHWEELPADRRAKFRFLHVSTDEVFGTLDPSDPPFTETSPYQPNSPYAASKAASDHFVRAFHRTFGLPTLLVNGSNAYGPNQFPEKLIPLMILHALEGRPLPLYGDGRQIRDWLYVGDFCEAVSRVLEKGAPGQSYAVGGQNEYSNRDVVEKICALMDELAPASFGPRTRLIECVADRPGHDMRYAIDPAKIQRELGWKAETAFADGLRNTVMWFLANKDWWQNRPTPAYDRKRRAT